MRILRQILILLGVWLAGELLSCGLGLPIPGNVIGMFLMLILLGAGVVKVAHIAEITGFFLDNLSFFFIPGAVALVVYFSEIRDQLLPILGSLVASSILVFLVTGYSVEALLKWTRARRKKREGDTGDAS